MAASASASASGAASDNRTGWGDHDDAVIRFALSLAEHFNFEFDVLTMDCVRFFVRMSRDKEGKWSATTWLNVDNDDGDDDDEWGDETPWVVFGDCLDDRHYDEVNYTEPNTAALTSFLPPSFLEWKKVIYGAGTNAASTVPLAGVVAGMFAHVRDTDKNVDLDAIAQALCTLALKSGEKATTEFTTGVMRATNELAGGSIDLFAKDAGGTTIYSDNRDGWNIPWDVSTCAKDLTVGMIDRLSSALQQAKSTVDGKRRKSSRQSGKGKAPKKKQRTEA